MKISRRRFLSVSAVAAIAAGIGVSARRKSVWRGHALGAEAAIELSGPEQVTAPALTAAVDTIRRMESLFSLYDPNSAISRLNETGSLHMPPEFSRLVGTIGEVNKITGGLFDPTIQSLYLAANSKRQLNEDRKLTSVHIGWDKVEIVRNRISFDRPGMAVTFNGIAQGFATDRVREVLNQYGLGDIRVDVGEHWVGTTGTNMPIADMSNRRITSLHLKNEAIATSSADALRLRDGRSHILYPGGDRRKSVWKTVSVVAQTATIADGLSTALSLAPDTMLASKLVDAEFARKIVLEDAAGIVREI